MKGYTIEWGNEGMGQWNRAIAFKKIIYQEKKIENRQKKVYFLKKFLRNPS